MELRYDITAVGQNQIRSVIRGVEQEILASNRRMTSAIRGTGAGRPRALGAGSAASESKALARAAINEDAKVWRAKEQQARRFARIEIRAIEEESDKRLKAIKKEASERAKLIQSIGKGAGKTVVGSIGGMARAGMGAASLAGGVAIASALHDQMQVQAMASRVANQGERPDLKGALATGAQQLKGFTGEEALSALDQFVQKSGDLKGGIAAWQMMGQVSLATSSDITEVGEAAGSAFNLIEEQTKDPIKRIELLRDVMETLAVQGNKGSIEMRNFASVLPMLAASARKFDGPQGANLKTVGALAQLSVKRGGASNAEEAATSIGRFLDDLVTDSKAGKKHGALNVFSDKSHTKLRDVGGIISDVMDQTGGDLTKIQGMFGVRGRRAFSGVAPAYLEAFNAAETQKKGTGKVAGRAAVSSALEEFTGAGLGPGELERRAQTRLDDPDLQIKEAVKQFNVAIGTQLMPVLTRLIPQFTALVPTVSDLTSALVTFVQFLSQDPYVGIGAIIAAKITADLTEAAIGAAAKKALATSFGQSGGVMIGSFVATVAAMNVIMGLKEQGANNRLNAMNANEQNIRDQAKLEMDTTGLTPETRTRLEAVLKQEEARTTGKQFEDPLKGVGVGRQFLNTISGGLTGPTIFNDKTVTGSVDASRATENIENKAKTEALLAQADAAKDLRGAAADLRLASATMKELDSSRSKPIVAR